MKRIFVIHGWEGRPEEGWFPWIKKELESKGCKVTIPSMPNPDEPEINAWVNHLKELVGKADEETFFIGHSIGCQTILRYLESLDEGVKVGGAIFVAGFVNLVLDEDEDEAVARPWLETPINWEKIKSHTTKFVAIFSDNDPFVPVSDSKIFEEKLGSKIIIKEGKGHLSEEHGVMELPEVLEEITKSFS